MEKIALIVAGGAGSRMNTDIPKQFLPLAGLPILMHTIKKFWNFDNSIRIIITLPESYIRFWKRLCKDYRFQVLHEVKKGGETRFDSVKKGLRGLKPGSLVAIHDGVRPLVSRLTIKRCFAMAEKSGTAVPVIDVSETVRILNSNHSILAERDKVKLVQTPQAFKSEILIKAFRQKYDPKFTDDASVVEKKGVHINLVEGNTENIKITTKTDLIVAEAYYRNTF